MITVPTVQVAAGVVITLFLLQLAKKYSAGSDNGIVSGLNGGLTFLLGPG